MALTLAQAAVIEKDQLRKGILEIFVQESAVLDEIPFMPIEGNAYRYNLELTLPGVAFRSVNEAYVESTGTFNQLFEGLTILGGDADVDRFIQQTRSSENNQRAEQDKLKVKALSYKYQDHFFNGDIAVDPKGFDGLKKRLVNNQVMDFGTNGGAVVGNGASDAHTFFDGLDDLLSRVPNANVLYANNAIARKILSAGRRIGGADLVKNDITGKREVTWQGIPVKDPGDNLLGGRILSQTETLGANSDTSSIYAVRWGGSEGDGGVTGLTNGGVQVDDLGELQEKPAFRTRIEFYSGLALFSGKAAARMRGVRNL